MLMACASDGQRRPGLAESADLIRSGLWMRLRPSVPQSARTVRATVRLMCAGAAVNTVYLIIALVQKTPYCWPGLARDGRPITALRGQWPVVNDPLHDER